MTLPGYVNRLRLMTSPPESVYDLVRQAILDQKQVTGYYDGLYREMCPHVLGWKDGRPHALFFQFGGQSRSGSHADWRCLDLYYLSNVEVRDGDWYMGTGHSRRQTCVDIVDVEIPF
jgi:hypothetical protein